MKSSILETVGSPLVAVDAPQATTIAAKIESFNPGGSAKDRPALAMIEAAERDGLLDAGDTIVEATSGNTGIGIAMVGATRGYDVRIVMPASRSPERRQVMQAYSADLELVEGGMETANARASELADQPGFLELSQFDNPANPQAHYETTGPELLDQLDGRQPDALVAGVGTGGTITGVGRRLREAFPDLHIVAVEPEANAVLSGETDNPEGDEYQGMGPGFVSENLDRDLLDDVETVALSAAEAECRRLAREEGILVGQSSGASNVAAKRVARQLREEGTEPLVVTVFWDSGERYLTTGLFEK